MSNFNKKTWVNRSAQYPLRRRLTATADPNVFDVTREEGTVNAQGNKPDANELNDLEQRIYDAVLSKLDASAYTAADVLIKIKTVDGLGSGLDADLLDGLNSNDLLKVTYEGIGDGNLATDQSKTYYCYSSGVNVPSNVNEWFVNVQMHANGNLHQVWKSFNTGVVEEYHRERLNGTWGAFYKIYHNGNYDKAKPIYGSYTLTAADNGKRIVQMQADANNYTITIPTGLTEFTCTVFERYFGTGKTTIAPAVGVTLYSNPDNTKRTLNGNSSGVSIWQYEGTESYNLTGNLKV